MQQAGLDFQQAPPISVPFRFFLTAPLFALMAAGLTLWQGADLLESRWSLATLAVVHLLTLGFMTMVMAGAMIQILPVLAGAAVPKPRLVAGIIHPALTLGAMLLAGGLLVSRPLVLQAGVLLLGAGLAVFFGMMGLTLSRVRNPNATILAMWLAIAAFGVMLVFGLMLGASRAWGTDLPSASLPNLHPLWGLIGWTGLLVAGAAYPIVPMFQITPKYPSVLTRSFAVVVFAALALSSLAQWQGEHGIWLWLSLACVGMLALAHIAFAAVTLDLQRRRRRRLPDVTLEFWRIGMICVILAALLWLSQSFPGLAFPQSEVLLGVLVIVGAAFSFIIGMLCKIVPFLVWFHLQAMLGLASKPPNMKAMLPEKSQRMQLRLHLLSLLLLSGAALWPAFFTYPAALSFGAASALLFWNMVCVTRIYRDFVRRGAHSKPAESDGVISR
jgi:hypothetical protein